uniref:Guided entry of tail-anchored proteins factor 4 n=1 Tax=Sus scrofa TaxID=9823 RepID=A0A8D0UFF8_PIG
MWAPLPGSGAPRHLAALSSGAAPRSFWGEVGRDQTHPHREGCCFPKGAGAGGGAGAGAGGGGGRYGGRKGGLEQVEAAGARGQPGWQLGLGGGTFIRRSRIWVAWEQVWGWPGGSGSWAAVLHAGSQPTPARPAARSPDMGMARSGPRGGGGGLALTAPPPHRPPEQNYCESRYHFLHSSDGEGCANMLVEYSTSRGFRSEVDMFVAQAVLQFLCLKNKSSASVVFTTYTQKHPSIENGPPFVQPLLNFIWFLLLALDGGKLAVFTVLCEQYQPSLRRDPMYNEYLDRIGQLFFGVPPKQTASYGGLLGNLLSSLMGSSEQEGEDSQDDSSPIELD